MTDTICPLCSRGVAPGQVIDAVCARRAVESLRSIAELLQLAPAAISKRRSNWTTGDRLSAGVAGSRLPLNATVQQATETVRRSMLRWAEFAAEQGQTVVRTSDPRRATLWLIDLAYWWQGQWWAPEAAEDWARAARGLRGVLDTPEPASLVGRCEHRDDEGTVRTTWLYARGNQGSVVCSTCRARYDVAESRAGMLDALDDRLVTLAEAVRLLTPQVSRASLYRVVARHAVEQHGTLPTATQPAAAYRLAELRDAVAQAEADRRVRAGRARAA